jgi:hypothetical protein
MPEDTATPAPASINLKAALKTNLSNPTAWVEFREGISFKLKFMPKATWRKLADECTEFRYNPLTKNREPKLDTDAFLKKFLRDAVLDWKGATLRSLSQIVDIDVDGYTPEQMMQPLPFDCNELPGIVDRCPDLDTFINASVLDIKTFRPLLDEEVKNSKTSQSGS